MVAPDRSHKVVLALARLSLREIANPRRHNSFEGLQWQESGPRLHAAREAQLEPGNPESLLLGGGPEPDGDHSAARIAAAEQQREGSLRS